MGSGGQPSSPPPRPFAFRTPASGRGGGGPWRGQRRGRAEHPRPLPAGAAGAPGRAPRQERGVGALRPRRPLADRLGSSGGHRLTLQPGGSRGAARSGGPSGARGRGATAASAERGASRACAPRRGLAPRPRACPLLRSPRRVSPQWAPGRIPRYMGRGPLAKRASTALREVLAAAGERGPPPSAGLLPRSAEHLSGVEHPPTRTHPAPLSVSSIDFSAEKRGSLSDPAALQPAGPSDLAQGTSAPCAPRPPHHPPHVPHRQRSCGTSIRVSVYIHIYIPGRRSK